MASIFEIAFGKDENFDIENCQAKTPKLRESGSPLYSSRMKIEIKA